MADEGDLDGSSVLEGVDMGHKRLVEAREWD